MNQLVSYSETSSDEDERTSTTKHSYRKCNVDKNKMGKKYENADKQNVSVQIMHRTKQNCTEYKQIIDLPITNESGYQNSYLVSRDNKLKPCTSVGGNFAQSYHFLEKQTDSSIEKKVKDTSISKLDTLANNNSNCLTPWVVFPTLNKTEGDAFDQRQFFSKEKNFLTEGATELVGVQKSVEPKSSCLAPSRKRKCIDESDKVLLIPDSIHTMYHERVPKWLDNPAQHDNRIRSFAHVEGNWATHMFIPVARSDPIVRFVNSLLGFLSPSFQMQPEFHISLSRTVAIRYHWIEPLVESLRENFNCLKSCISDFSAVKLFTNDEKTRTFVSIELSQDDREFHDYVKAVDKSFADFKLPAYYENPSFHISIGWCLGDAVTKISADKLSRAQEMLGEFMAANPDDSFVYARSICCQSGCKSIVIPLQDSVV